MIDISDLDEEGIYLAIRDGVTRAILQLAASATDTPCADFYQAIEDGTAKAVKSLGGTEKLRDD